MATLTLAQYAQLSKQPLAKGLLLGITQQSVVADIMNFRSLGGALSENGVRYDEVIQPDWVALDGSISSKTANGKPLSYSVYQMAVHIDIPTLIDENNKDQLARQSTQQVKLAIKGMAYEVNDTFINGDQGANANQFNGLNKMVADLASGQTVGSAEIDLTASYTAALAESLYKRLDTAFLACEGGKPDAVFCNDTFLTQLRSFARQSGLAGNNHDWMNATFDVNDPRRTERTASTRPSFFYEQVPFYNLGLKYDQSTRIITNAYAEGGSSAATRLFCVKFGAEDLEGIQAAPLETQDIGALESKDVTRKRVKWTLGLANWGPRSIVKVAGIKVA